MKFYSVWINHLSLRDDSKFCLGFFVSEEEAKVFVKELQSKAAFSHLRGEEDFLFKEHAMGEMTEFCKNWLGR